MFESSSFWLLIPFVILNAFYEEILVRGYLMTEIIELRSSVVLATFVSIALQTSYHLYYGIVGALSVGGSLAVLALYYAKTRDLMPVIVSHLLWDLMALLRI
jgi:membrane protease YdiL (CAAX protease family)